MHLDQATGTEILERYARAWEAFDGDAWTALFTEEIEYHVDPFEPPMVGHNALRAYLLEAAATQDQVEMTVERHWVVEPTILASWHASFIRRSGRERVRIGGFMILEVAGDGRIGRFRQWWHERETPVAT